MAEFARREAEDRLLLALELEARRSGDPLLRFEPYEKQRRFTDACLDPSGPPECFFLAANRSGKSDAGAFVGASLGRFGSDAARFVGGRYDGVRSGVEVRDRAVSGWIVSLDFPSSRDIIQPKYFDNGYVPPGSTHEPFIPAREIEHWDKEGQILKLKNGSIIGFKSCDSGRLKFQGTGKDFIHFDEEPPEDIYNEAVIRVEAGRRLRVFMTCTLLPPAGSLVGGVTWIFQKKVDPWKKSLAPDYRGPKLVFQIFTAGIYDNPFLLRDEVARLEAIYPIGSIDRRIRLQGELIPVTAGARIYGNFDHALHLRHLDAPLPRQPLDWFWDFNVQPMLSAVGQYDGKVFRVFREFHLETGSIPAMCEMFKRFFPYHFANVRLFGDASGHTRSHQSNLSSYHYILHEMVGYPVQVQLLAPDVNPFVTDRVNSVNYALKNQFGAIGVEVDQSCSELIGDFEQVISDGKGGIKKVTNLKDPYARRTHISDAFGYWVTQLAPILAQSPKPTHAGARAIPKMPSYNGRRARR